jgi:hypothetical protein
MAYKMDGAKFPTLEELVEALYPMYSDKMSEEEFQKIRGRARGEELTPSRARTEACVRGP